MNKKYVQIRNKYLKQIMKKETNYQMEQESKKWTGEELLAFYRSFSSGSFLYAAQNDLEMSNYIHALSYYKRAEITKKVHFEGISKEIINTSILAAHEGFLRNFENRVNKGDENLFSYIFKDTELYQKGGVYNTEEAVYAMRDEVLGGLINEFLYKLGTNIYNIESFQSPLKDLMKYNPVIHKGSKYNCYKNHILTDPFGLMVFGSSMLFQVKMGMEDINDFDSFCDKFDEFLRVVLNQAEIGLESAVIEGEFDGDIKRIFDVVSGRNMEFFFHNYELVFDQVAK